MKFLVTRGHICPYKATAVVEADDEDGALDIFDSLILDGLVTFVEGEQDEQYIEVVPSD